MKTILWLDDFRDPYTGKFSVEVLYLKEEYLGIEQNTEKCKVYWVRTQTEFEKYIKENGLPNLISFDDDLGIGNGEGYDCAKWLVEYCMDNNKELPKWYIHSANPVARKNIKNLLYNFEYKKEVLDNKE